MCKIRDRITKSIFAGEPNFFLYIAMSKQTASYFSCKYSYLALVVQIYGQNGEKNKNKPPNERVDKEMRFS